MGKLVTIKKIRVEELFDQFSYELELDNPDNVSVIIGPNGIGKTTVLNMLGFLLQPEAEKLNRISKVPFRFFELCLSDGIRVILKRAEKNRKGRRITLPLRPDIEEYIFGAGYEWEVEITNGSESRKIRPARDINALARFKNAADPESEETQLQYKEELCTGLAEWIYDDPKEYEKEDFAPDGNSLRLMSVLWDNFAFITSNRINDREHYRYSGAGADGQKRKLISSPLKEMDERITSLVRPRLEEYEALLTRAHIRLPKEYLKAGGQPDLSKEEFKEGWAEYCETLKQFQEIGLLGSEFSSPEIGDLDQAYDMKGVFLCSYLKLFEKTLEPLHLLYDELHLFAEIINKRNEATQKRLQITRDGLKMLVNGSKVGIDCLSSGEKNDLVLFFELLYCGEEGVVLIDEPEISWHIVWQEEFLDQLLEICRLRNMQAIVTTHSPNIINGHFDLVAQRSEL